MHKAERGTPQHPRSLILTDLCWRTICQEWRVSRAEERDLTGALFGTATPRRARATYFLLANQTATADERLRRLRLLRLRPLGRVQTVRPDQRPAPFLYDLDFTTAPGDVMLWIAGDLNPLIVAGFLVQANHPQFQRIPVHIERSPLASTPTSEEVP